MTQTELARKARMSCSAICMIEYGERTPRVKNLKAIAAALKVDRLATLVD